MERHRVLALTAAVDMSDDMPSKRCCCVVMVAFQRHIINQWLVRDGQYKVLLRQRRDIDERAASPKVELFSTQSAGSGKNAG